VTALGVYRVNLRARHEPELSVSASDLCHGAILPLCEA
jgi:hypothetical protein